ncbi:MAG: dTDP-4-dehydrorhamnose 3,5-epimerase [Candidatus Thiodiazotropha sp. (ex Myrtea sp. 'scaly one' KF741663)]|nr:dTDP-4-dehydrorhamnose 3,5-epimerase [Candidatus Thiodiazotropha sp. (ex Myrtea sp. 'scaly one' KF741663)]
MNVVGSPISDVLLLEPEVFGDDRGFFMESFNQLKFNKAVGRQVSFVQDNHSRSSNNVLRGLHYQIKQTQGKLIRVLRGSIFDVVVDLRKSSSSFGQWFGTELSEDNKREIWVPEGFAHGFLALSDFADILYKTTDYYSPKHERCIRWDDLNIGIDWPIEDKPLLSEVDKNGLSWEDAEMFS